MKFIPILDATMHEEITLTREIEAIQIPSGEHITLPMGTEVFITQRLGGTFTVACTTGLARISGEDADALGIDLKAEEEIHSEKERIATSGTLEEQVWAQLETVFDPEIPVDIVNLGLVYDMKIEDENDQKVVKIQMTLTAQGCGMGPAIAADAQGKIMSIDGISDAIVEVVWDPPWNQDMITEEGKMQLGMI